MTSSEQNPIKLRFHKLRERALAVVRPPDGAVPVERVYNVDVHEGSCAELISCGHPQESSVVPVATTVLDLCVGQGTRPFLSKCHFCAETDALSVPLISRIRFCCPSISYLALGGNA